MPRFGVARAGLLATLVLVTVACGDKTPPFPDHLFVPDGVGVIRDIEPLQIGGRLTLESGETFDLDGTDTVRQIESGGGDPGDLVIYGEENGQPWVSLWSREQDTDDGWILYAPAWELDDSFAFLSGMRLPKAPEFTRVEGRRGPSEDGYYVAATLVANERGEIILVR